MSFPRYPKYQDSGVGLVREVPAHWSLPKLKHVASFSGGGTPSRENMAYWNGGIPWVSPKDMKAEQIVGAEESITVDGLRSSASSLLPPGHVLMVVRSGILKHTIPVAINQIHVALNQDMKALRFANTRCLSKFFLRWVQGLNDLLLVVWAKQGATVESIEHDYLANTVIPLPPVVEQSSIATFLDRETAKIDALVAEQRRLIELLKEKRQAVISHAVTKGLNPHVPMEDSGIEWLGDVPAHWEVGPLKRYWAVTDCKHITAEFAGDGIPVASIREVQSRWVDLSSAKFTTTHYYEELIEGGRKPLAGDLIFSRNATVGEVAQVSPEHPPFAMGQDVVLLRKLSSDYSSNYLQNLIRSPIIVQQIANLMIGSTFKRINVDDIRSFVLPMPPPNEQKAIAAYLASELSKFDALTEATQSSIDLLQERRTALISAAVTGQIDVRLLSEKQAGA